ncbi:MAG: DUF1844 domain-containing protein [Armatimonadetes bacterium]|nr:DUF1844 domain-containing protein [Armatimonadota bacterium]
MQENMTEETVNPQESESPETSGLPLPRDVYELLKAVFSMLYGQAWQNLGLVPNPVTRLIVKDLAQAKTAIDCAAFILDKIEDKMEEREKAEYRKLLSDLKGNFVLHSQTP